MDPATLNKLGTIALIVVWPFAMYHALRSYFRKRVPPANVDVDAVIREFARRRRIMIRATVATFAGFGYLFLLQSIRPLDGMLWGLSFTTHLLIGFAVIGVGIAVGSFVYRCPACGSPPWASTGRGVDLNPVACPRCGTPLQ